MERRGRFSEEQDQRIREIIGSNTGNISFKDVAIEFNRGLPSQFRRTARQIRQRWEGYLSPKAQEETWTVQEINVVYQMMKNNMRYPTIAKTLNRNVRSTRSLMKLLETNSLPLLRHLQSIDPTEQLSLPYFRELAEQPSRMENRWTIIQNLSWGPRLDNMFELGMDQEDQNLNHWTIIQYQPWDDLCDYIFGLGMYQEDPDSDFGNHYDFDFE